MTALHTTILVHLLVGYINGKGIAANTDTTISTVAGYIENISTTINISLVSF